MASGMSLLTTILNIQERRKEREIQQWLALKRLEQQQKDRALRKKELDVREKNLGVSRDRLGLDRLKYKDDTEKRDRRARARQSLAEAMEAAAGENADSAENQAMYDLFENAPLEQSMPLFKQYKQQKLDASKPLAIGVEQTTDGLVARWFDSISQTIKTQELGYDQELPADLQTEKFYNALSVRRDAGDELNPVENKMLDNYLTEQLKKHSTFVKGQFGDDESLSTGVRQVTQTPTGVTVRDVTEFRKPVRKFDRTQIAANKDLMETSALVDRMKHAQGQYEELINAGFDPLSLLGKGETLFHNISAKIFGMTPQKMNQALGIDESDPRYTTVAKGISFVSNAWDNFNRYRKFITGVQAGFKELEWLKKAFANPDDSGLAFTSKAEGYIKIMDLHRRHLYAFGAINPGKEIYVTDRDGNPIGYTEDYKRFTRRFGLNDSWDSDANQERVIDELRHRDPDISDEEVLLFLEEVFE